MITLSAKLFTVRLTTSAGVVILNKDPSPQFRVLLSPAIKGDQGDAGADGEDGVDGLSAYQIAVNNGFVGSEAAWLLSLKGDQGDAGADGTMIHVGTTPPGSPAVGDLWLDTN